MSGVKKPAPVAVGRGGCAAVFVVSCSSEEVHLIGRGREENNSSISGTDPRKWASEGHSQTGEHADGATWHSE